MIFSYKRAPFQLFLVLFVTMFLSSSVQAQEWVIQDTIPAPLELVEVNFTDSCEGVSFPALGAIPEGNALVLRTTDEAIKDQCLYWWVLDTTIAYEDGNAVFWGSTGTNNSVVFSTTENPTVAYYCENGIVSNPTENCASITVRATSEVTQELSSPENRPNAAENTGSEAQQGEVVRPPPSCESENSGLLDRLLCAFTRTIDRVLVGKDGTGGMAGVVDELLSITPEQYANESLKQSWTYFRNIASLALVLIGLIMVIGQAISKE